MNQAQKDNGGLVGRPSPVVPGRFGQELKVEQVRWSRKQGTGNPSRPIFVLMHGWGSNEEDMADLMRYVAPYNDYASLRAPMVVPGSERGMFGPGYTWFHDMRPEQEDLDRDGYAAARAVDAWVSANIPEDRPVVAMGFSQGAMLAVHLLRVNPERYRASICLSGFLAPGLVPGTAPADERLAGLNKPVFLGFGSDDTTVPKYEFRALAAWLDEHVWLHTTEYDHLEHAVDMREMNDLRQWLGEIDVTSGLM
ncbi:alpha/beta hydrolase [Bifidobacterium sp. ESL0827]|uniref:alpha/beta hydrolase n=1 Tax=Bifidobacterium sp. ESL0827 TaxID=3448583 RepID=UPI0040423045